MPANALQTRPKMRHTCDELEKLANRLGPDSQMPTMVQLRDSLGVSMRTLHDSLREMERRQVLRSVHGVGIFVESRQKRAATDSIGFLAIARLTSVQNLTYYGLITAGMRRQGSQVGQDILLIDSQARHKNWQKIDGVVLYNMTDSPVLDLSSHNLPAGFPVVSIIQKTEGFSSVVADDRSGTYRLTRHLIELGHRRIAYLAVNAEKSPIMQKRREGYHAALQEAGIRFEPAWQRDLAFRKEWSETDDWYFPGGQYYTREWLADNWRELGCTALVAQNDETAYGAIAAFNEAGISVPGDVSVTGFDGNRSANSFLPSLTTARVPLFEIGEKAVSMICDRFADPDHAEQHIVLPVEFMPGRSTAAPR